MTETYPLIERSNFIYTRMLMLEWITEGTSLCRVIHSRSVGILCEIIDQKQLPMIVNCDDITKIDNHAFSDLKINLPENAVVILKNLYPAKSDDVVSIVNDNNDKVVQVEKIEEGVFVIHNGRKPSIKKLLSTNFEKIESEHAKMIINKCFDLINPNDRNVFRRLPSSPVSSNGVFCSRKLCSDYRDFMWISVLLAKEAWYAFENDIPPERNFSAIKILSVSLGAAPFAAMVSILTGIELEVIDHLGPLHRVYENDSIAGILPNTAYIFIGDFMIAGTELRVATNFAELKASKIVSSVFIGSALEEDAYRFNHDIKTILCLRKTVTDLKYRFQ